MNTISPHYEIWRYSNQYSSINSEGGQKPPPAFGSPTLVWHLGVWQRWDADEVDSAPQDGSLKSRFRHFDNHNMDFFCEIRDFIEHLQKRGRILDPTGSPDGGIEKLRFQPPRGVNPDTPHRALGKPTHPFHICEPQSLSFTLWWQDSDDDGAPALNTRQASPDYSALRVRVQVQTHVDHVTLSFFIDAAKPYGRPQIYTTDDKIAPNFGRRRHKIASYLERMREICGAQIRHGFVERDRLPERFYPLPKKSDFDDGAAYERALLDHPEKEKQAAADLLEIADYFYEDIWTDFLRAFDVKLPVRESGRDRADNGDGGGAGSLRRHGKIFANFRGLVMSVKGVKTEDNGSHARSIDNIRHSVQAPQPETPLESEANPGFGKFLAFDARSGEPNTVLKSLWPFLRRVIPWADYRDFVGCGILDWRALYVTAPGTAASFYEDQEAPGRKHELPAGSPPGLERTGLHEEWEPMRYLVVTKGEPHREQVGRFVERINALGTMRLFALKNVRVVKNAGTHLRLLGHELDGVLHQWVVERGKIEKRHRALMEGVRRKNVEERSTVKFKLRSLFEKLDRPDELMKWSITPGGVIENPEHRKAKSLEELEVDHQRTEELGELIRETEQRLIELTSALDRIGRGGAGRILYVINRSKYYGDEFQRLWPTLDTGNIEGWISYATFVERGLKPTFSLIGATGKRLLLLRNRLQSITEMIQTSALIIETEATKSNTAQLSRIATSLYYVEIPLILIAGRMVIQIAADLGMPQVLGTILGAIAVGAYLFYRYLTRQKAMRNIAALHDDEDGIREE